MNNSRNQQKDIRTKEDDDTIKYCHDFICTYHLHDLEDQDDMYKCQMIQAFMIEDWYDDIVNKTVRNLYKEIISETNPHYLENIAQMERIYEKLNGNLFPNKEQFKIDKRLVLFQSLFGFDYFFKTHALICDFLNNKIISSKLIDDLAMLIHVGQCL